MKVVYPALEGGRVRWLKGAAGFSVTQTRVQTLLCHLLAVTLGRYCHPPPPGLWCPLWETEITFCGCYTDLCGLPCEVCVARFIVITQCTETALSGYS